MSWLENVGCASDLQVGTRFAMTSVEAFLMAARGQLLVGTLLLVVLRFTSNVSSFCNPRSLCISFLVSIKWRGTLYFLKHIGPSLRLEVSGLCLYYLFSIHFPNDSRSKIFGHIQCLKSTSALYAHKIHTAWWKDLDKPEQYGYLSMYFDLIFVSLH